MRIHVYLRRSAMHGAVEFHTRRWGYVTVQPPMHVFRRWWPWGVCVSPNATPWAATFLAGPCYTAAEKRDAATRRVQWGHNYSTDHHDPQEEHHRAAQGESGGGE